MIMTMRTPINNNSDTRANGSNDPSTSGAIDARELVLHSTRLMSQKFKPDSKFRTRRDTLQKQVALLDQAISMTDTSTTGSLTTQSPLALQGSPGKTNSLLPSVRQQLLSAQRNKSNKNENDDEESILVSDLEALTKSNNKLCKASQDSSSETGLLKFVASPHAAKSLLKENRLHKEQRRGSSKSSVVNLDDLNVINISPALQKVNKVEVKQQSEESTTNNKKSTISDAKAAVATPPTSKRRTSAPTTSNKTSSTTANSRRTSTSSAPPSASVGTLESSDTFVTSSKTTEKKPFSASATSSVETLESSNTFVKTPKSSNEKKSSSGAANLSVGGSESTDTFVKAPTGSASVGTSESSDTFVKLPKKSNQKNSRSTSLSDVVVSSLLVESPRTMKTKKHTFDPYMQLTFESSNPSIATSGCPPSPAKTVGSTNTNGTDTSRKSKPPSSSSNKQLFQKESRMSMPFNDLLPSLDGTRVVNESVGNNLYHEKEVFDDIMDTITTLTPNIDFQNEKKKKEVEESPTSVQIVPFGRQSRRQSISNSSLHGNSLHGNSLHGSSHHGASSSHHGGKRNGNEDTCKKMTSSNKSSRNSKVIDTKDKHHRSSSLPRMTEQTKTVMSSPGSMKDTNQRQQRRPSTGPHSSRHRSRSKKPSGNSPNNDDKSKTNRRRRSTSRRRLVSEQDSSVPTTSSKVNTTKSASPSTKEHRSSMTKKQQEVVSRESNKSRKDNKPTRGDISVLSDFDFSDSNLHNSFHNSTTGNDMNNVDDTNECDNFLAFGNNDVPSTPLASSSLRRACTTSVLEKTTDGWIDLTKSDNKVKSDFTTQDTINKTTTPPSFKRASTTTVIELSAKARNKSIAAATSTTPSRTSINSGRITKSVGLTATTDTAGNDCSMEFSLIDFDFSLMNSATTTSTMTSKGTTTTTTRQRSRNRRASMGAITMSNKNSNSVSLFHDSDFCDINENKDDCCDDQPNKGTVPETSSNRHTTTTNGVSRTSRRTSISGCSVNSFSMDMEFSKMIDEMESTDNDDHDEIRRRRRTINVPSNKSSDFFSSRSAANIMMLMLDEQEAKKSPSSPRRSINAKANLRTLKRMQMVPVVKR